MKTIRTDDGKGGFIETTTDQQNSVKISENAKGGLSWEIKIYEDDSEKLNTKFDDYIRVVKNKLKTLEQNRV